jgi:hypothetical protein
MTPSITLDAVNTALGTGTVWAMLDPDNYTTALPQFNAIVAFNH